MSRCGITRGERLLRGRRQFSVLSFQFSVFSSHKLPNSPCRWNGFEPGHACFRGDRQFSPFCMVGVPPLPSPLMLLSNGVNDLE